MTVVGVLDLDGKTCVASADERVTYGGIRTFDIYKKLFCLGKSSVIGFSGSGSYAKEILDELEATVSEKGDLSVVVPKLEGSYSVVREKKMRDFLLHRFFLEPDDVKKLPEDSIVAKEVLDQLRSGNFFDLVFAVCGYDERKKAIRIHTVGYPGHSYAQEKYVTIGSGSDRAHRDIGDSLQRMASDERTRIEPYKGVKILMEATQSAWRNEGVGGVTQIILVGEDTRTEIGRAESNLLNTALFCEERGVLGSDYVDGLFQKIVHDKASADELRRELDERVPHEQLSRLFWTQSLHV